VLGESLYLVNPNI